VEIEFYDELLAEFANNEHMYLHFKKLILDIDKDITEWNKSDVNNFLFGLRSTSQNSLNRYLRSLRYIHEYSCKKKNIPYTPLKPSFTIKTYIDYPKLRSQIITYEDYIFIRNELDFYLDGELRNVRDKVIFELAWEGLSATEIKHLKETDIEFIDDKIKIQLQKRVIWITDPIVVLDIKRCLNEIQYYQINSTGVIKKYNYKPTKYLIKPIEIRSDMFYKQTAEVTMIFGKIVKKLSLDIGRKSKDWDGTEHDLDIEALTIKNIRRSKMIYLLQFKYITAKGIQEIFGKRQWKDISWLTEISRKVYGE